jgi:predicted MFS family arabinose efflux permease
MNQSASKITSRVGYLLGLGMLAKFFVDTANQLFNPYLMIYAAGIGVSGITMGKMISLRNLSGLIAPVIGSLADRYGYRRLMRLNLLLVALGLLLFALGNRMVPILLGMVIWGVGQGGYTPNVHSYLSSRLPYEKRSRYLGMLEYSWAMAGIVGLSLMGLIIQGVSWRLPLFLLSGGLAGSALLMGTLPGNHTTSEARAETPAAKGWSAAQLRDFFHLGPHRRSAWAAVAVNVFNFFAAFHIIITHGAYLDIEFGLTPARLGSVALVMGLIDWSASILVSTAGDRIGKRRSMMIGSIGLILSSLLLPFMKGSLIIAIIGLMAPVLLRVRHGEQFPASERAVSRRPGQGARHGYRRRIDRHHHCRHDRSRRLSQGRPVGVGADFGGGGIGVAAFTDIFRQGQARKRT